MEGYPDGVTDHRGLTKANSQAAGRGEPHPYSKEELDASFTYVEFMSHFHQGDPALDRALDAQVQHEAQQRAKADAKERNARQQEVRESLRGLSREAKKQRITDMADAIGKAD